MSAQTKVLADSGAVVGKRVILRPPAERDLEEFIGLNRRSARFHSGLVSPPVDTQQFLEYLERGRRPDSASFLMCSTESGAILGAISLSQIFRAGFQSAYLGYFVGAPFAGQGYMTEAIQLILRYAFKQLRLHRLEANIQPGNIASIALVRRAGFVREGYSRRYLKICGQWRDHERWAIIAEDWKPRNLKSRSTK